MPHFPYFRHLALPALLSLATTMFSNCLLADGDVTEVLEHRRSLDRSIWEEERLAQEYETAFINLWDKMRAFEDQSVELAKFPFQQLKLPSFSLSETLKENVQRFLPEAGTERSLSQGDFAQLIADYRQKGFRIEQSEWHHASFEAADGAPAQSVFTFAIHAMGPAPEQQRYILKGEIEVVWQSQQVEGVYYPSELALGKAQLLTRPAPAPFEHTLWLEAKPGQTPYGVVLIEDLNGDGLPDIAFPRRNALYINEGDFNFRETLLAKFMIKGLPTSAFFADLNLDGNIEYVVSTLEAPFLFAYSLNPATKAFDGKPFGIWKSDTPLETGLLAAGDITGDGYPEIYLGQSAPAYENGKVPTPYFDANDGRPAFLLRNNGNLSFTDITEQTSIAEKRRRRAFTASFQDLNNDQRLDLLVTSDFSGVDLHENQNGTLVDKTNEYFAERSLFGMSHAFADYDRDGAIDLLAVGMSSTTARRLERMGLGRDEFPKHQEMRMRIAKGNRLYYQASDGSFVERPAGEDVARSGWSWGSSSFDFNNDSYPDIFIANGYQSRSTARDYCSNFWTHDIYAESKFSQSQLGEFYSKFGPEALVGGDQMGWNPFEKDNLFLNLDGEGFVNVAYLFGVSQGGDGRAAIDQDFDRDGRSDLLLIELDSVNALERVHLFRNTLQTDGNWIGVDLRQAPGKAILGTRVTLRCPEFTTERLLTHGETFSGQRASTLHFGLGENSAVTQIEILWPDGERSVIENPKVNAYLLAQQEQ